MNSFFENLKERTKSEWTKLAQDKLTAARIYVQEHGEVAFLGGVVFGILFIVFFKLFVGILVVAGLGGFAIWTLAPDGPKVSIPTATVTPDMSERVTKEEEKSTEDNNSKF